MIKKINFPYATRYNIYLVDEINSTNTYFKDNYQQYENDSVLIALKQTAGRGRYDRVWQSDDDIIFSILKKNNGYYHLISPLSIALALKKLNINVGIKWPNDIYLNNKKLSGILIEDIYNNGFVASIIGIGINKTDKDNVLGIGLNIDVDKYYLIDLILNEFDNLSKMNLKDIIDLYKKYSIVIGKKIIYKNKEYEVLNIDSNGYLVVKNDSEKLTLSSDEINIKESLLN
ncbi:MAG: biotin--[acetyl-CoA-carboxylase] ligase [Acholeplasmatales bacterium]|nr:biotin--[acetyl-CoA-carboxylase] ligase [Acholeplasmatales bacterium]